MKYGIVFLYSLFLPLISYGQLELTLKEAISIAQLNSSQAQINKNSYKISNETFNFQRAQLLPQINLNGNFPGYNSSISGVTQPNGTIEFVTVQQAYSNIGIGLSQKIAATGGTFTASSNINRFDRLTGVKETNYNTQPFVLGFTQPIFKFNETAFSLKTARLNKVLGSKTFVRQQELLAMQVSVLYHSTLQIQVNIKLLTETEYNTDTLLKVAKLKLALGKIGEEEYLQVYLEKISIATQLDQLQGDYKVAKDQLCNILNISSTTEMILKENYPPNVLEKPIDISRLSDFFYQYRQNNPEYDQQKVVQLQVNAASQRAKFNNLPNINLIAGYGSNQSASQLNEAYRNVRNQQSFTLGFAVPLFTGGANAANIKIANYTLQNQQLRSQQLDQKTSNDLLMHVFTYNNSLIALSGGLLTDSLAQRRYEISENKYKAGKITYTELLLAQNQRNQNRLKLIETIATYWQVYYQLRTITLYDWEKQEQLYKPD